ncbi:hypothetical protein GJ699_29800 [Duganella sp. FT80W]|uniref:Flagellar FliJ protein n=1 Tax=Duganella guangzhouensis TaxID=2666084 RepID=A0A6I2L7G4_9BURK|nr:hypothetical protein [Duganella guangzhouensis]MRW94175.1 hypothetical protein [Duganella guangzhouensis]
MGARQFQYPLQPIAAQRQWALDALLLELNECNQALAQRHSECQAAREQVAQLTAAWREQALRGTALRADQHALWSGYLLDCRQRQANLEQALASLQEARDGLVEQVSVAQRALDAMDKHRVGLQREFVKAGLSAEFKSADDQWGVLQTIRSRDGD